MKAYIKFELAAPDTDEEPEETRFEVVGADPQNFLDVIHASQEFEEYIEDVEHGTGPRNGGIDQVGGGYDDDGTSWTFISSEIEDRRGFITQTVARIEEIFGWTLKEAT